MTTAVDAVFLGKERRFNRRFLRMCSHYLVEPTACTPAAGWEKGQVENQSLPRRRPGSAMHASTCSRRGCTLPITPS
jgi:transposase